MSDFGRQWKDVERRVEQVEVIERSPIYLSYAQRILNPLAAAGGVQAPGEMGQPWAAVLVVFTASVFVTTTNNGTNYWTIEIRDAPGATIASFNTSAIAASTWTRLSTTTITQPATTNAIVTVVVTPTLTPGTLYVVPSVGVFRTGN